MSFARFLIFAWLALPGTGSAQEDRREVAITFDDMPAASVRDQSTARMQATVRDILAALRRHHAPAIGFVNERKLFRNGTLDSTRLGVLADWIRAGHELGNHTWSHIDLHATEVERFEQGILRGERHVRRLANQMNAPFRFFRHPMLHTGRSLEVRDRVNRFLAAHGYVVAPVTMDNYDYVYSAAWERSIAAKDTAMARRIRADYVAYMDTIVGFYEQQARQIVGRLLPQVLLLHANPLNAVAFDDIAAMLSRRGYRFVTLEHALKDSAYASPDSYVGPAGITWLHRWALTARMPSSTYRGEPEVPDWVNQRGAR